MGTLEPERVDELKRRMREQFSTGDWAAVAGLVRLSAERLVGRVGPRAGEDVLDVACGTGNAAIPAALAGARVVGLDLTPKLLAGARDAAAAAGVTVEWVEGDAEALSLPDAAFDVVLSSFGVIFAPRHEVAAREIARVLRPGGRIGLTAWTPDSAMGDYFRVVAEHLPGSATPSQLEWGDPDHVSGLFAGTGVEPRFDREVVDFEFPSAEDALDFYVTRSGSVIAARAVLEPEGRWDDLREDLFEFFARHGRPDDDGVSWGAEYLVITGGKDA